MFWWIKTAFYIGYGKFITIGCGKFIKTAFYVVHDVGSAGIVCKLGVAPVSPGRLVPRGAWCSVTRILGGSVQLESDPDSGTSKSRILAVQSAPFWLRFRSRPEARRTELGTPRIGMRAQLFRTLPLKRPGSGKYSGKKRSRQKC